MSQNHSDVTVNNMGYKQELKRVLSTGDLIIYGLIFMVPIAPFGIYGVVADISQGMGYRQSISRAILTGSYSRNS